ncbi:MAG TPA: NDP-sugar synthase [Chthoniobacterales bacterium]
MTVRIEKAFVFAAGLGTRLRPLTGVLPKPLLPVFGKPLLRFALEHLRGVGVRSFALNTHHLAGAFDPYLESARRDGFAVACFHEPSLLGTGGALVNARTWIGADPVLLHSGDLLTDVDLTRLMKAHHDEGAEVTLGLRHTGLAAQVAFDPASRRVVDIRSTLGVAAPQNLDYANVGVVNGHILEGWKAGPGSLVAIVLDALRRGLPVRGVLLDDRRWFNVGTRHDYLEIHRTLKNGCWLPAFLPVPWWQEPWPSVRYAATGATWVAPDARVGADVELHDTVVWPGSDIAPGTRLNRCVVAGRAVGPGTFFEEDFA